MTSSLRNFSIKNRVPILLMEHKLASITKGECEGSRSGGACGEHQKSLSVVVKDLAFGVRQDFGGSLFEEVCVKKDSVWP